MWRGVLLLIALQILMSVPNELGAKAANPSNNQKGFTLATGVNHEATAFHNQASSGCPGTDEPSLSCAAIQSHQAERAANLFVGELAVSVFALFAASLAAGFAFSASRSASKSYKAFVAAEDAFLFVELPDGSIIETVSAEGVRSESYFLTALVTNLGRSAARLHRYVVGDNSTPILKTLKQDEGTRDGWAIQAESRDPFDLEIHYSTALRPKAVLSVTIQVVDLPHRHLRVGGAIVNTKLRPDA